MQEKNNVLYVRFFGAFSVRWNGEQLIYGRESQFTHLLQILLHTREKGADRALLINELFQDREIKDATHSMHVLFYNCKKRLKEMGLPDCAYIVEKSGRFYWTGEIPVIEDTVEFETAFQRANASPTQEGKLSGYLTACELYGGDFLPMRAESLWATQEARRYGDMFSDSVNQAAAILFDLKRYDRLQALGKYAARVQPFSDWEHITLKALVGLGHYAEADRLYRETERQYAAELGVQPDTRMLELREIITAGRRSGQKTLETIQKYLIGKHEPEKGAFLCSYAVFENIYRVMERMKERNGRSNLLMLCTMEKADGSSYEENDLQEKLVSFFEDAICTSLRKTDIVCRCGRLQYLVLLVNTVPEDCADIQARIDARFDMPESKYKIRYDYRA
ncbi:MAG: bacterial transcriptional activator domain-containing protein [Oscillospiraceae bacterium]|nr:bacterial transcriptional activator domain-containing protein [Oscillospiraceae bacterium]